MSDRFLTADELAELTGRKVKAKQIEVLRRMALPFWVNALGKPVVARVAIEGRRQEPATKPKEVWVMPGREPKAK
jgi:hypothetical protein